jgi:peptide/nickel transport system substrate-binding protein
MRKLTLIVIVLSCLVTAATCRRRGGDAVTVALPEKFTTFDTLTTTASDAAAERVRNLMFNSLMRKDANFDYVGELASDVKTSDDGKAIAFTLRDGVKFHNGKVLTSADVKYTIDQLFKAKGYKAGAFYDTVPVDKTAAPNPAPVPTAASNTVASSAPDKKTEVPTDANKKTEANTKPAEEPKTQRIAHITSVETPDAKTVVINIQRAALRNPLFSSLVAIPIVPEGSIDQQKESPVGSGPFKFVSFDASQNVVELAANADYWEGVPKAAKLRLKTVTDATSLQAELQSGGVDIAPNPSNLPPDMLKALSSNPNLKLEQSDGSNIQYLVFNTQLPPLNNSKVRQAIGYAIDRQKIVNDLLLGQAKVANSVVPEQSWAYTPGTVYTFDPAKAKQLLKEAGYTKEEVVFKFGAGNAATISYAQVIQNALNDVGINVRIETLEVNVIRTQLAQGQFQMFTGVWIGGNQDPLFMRDLFSSTKIPGGSVSCCNRSRYVNSEVDNLLESAVNTTDKAVAKDLYVKGWNAVSNDLPLLPLWYPANIVLSTKRIGNVKMNASGDWGFLKDITVSQ